MIVGSKVIGVVGVSSSGVFPESDSGGLFSGELEEASLSPTRLPSYFGAVLDIPNLLARPLEFRIVALQLWIQEFLNFFVCPSQTVAKTVGFSCEFHRLDTTVLFSFRCARFNFNF